MTKDEYIKAHCENCNIKDCGFRARGIQCGEIDLIEDTWDMCQESVVDKACKYLGTSEIANLSELQVKYFKQSMED